MAQVRVVLPPPLAGAQSSSRGALMPAPPRRRSTPGSGRPSGGTAPPGGVRVTEICTMSGLPSRAKHFAASPTVSRVTAVHTTRAAGFLWNTTWRISSRLPEVPPRNTRSGAGRSAKASGAVPATISRLTAWNRALFSASRARAASFFSTAYTRPAGQDRAHSTETEPVPAPTSPHTWCSSSRSLDRARARTSSLVMGTSPRRKAPSGRPEPFHGRTTGSGFSASRTDRSAKVSPASSAAVPVTMRSSE